MGNIVTKMVKTATFAVISFGFVATAGATDTLCEEVPDCLTLGYEKDIDCPAGTQIYCPYDVSFKKCVNAGCVELGYTLTNKTKWCKNIVYCPTDSSYTLCAENCTPCSNGELEPDCMYGLTLAGLDGCGHQCYQCKTCSLDIENGYVSAKTECNLSSYVISMVEPLCPENYSSGVKYICGSCPEGTAAPATNSTSCQCNENAGYYAACPRGAVCETVTTQFGTCHRTVKGGGDDPENDGCKDSEGWVPSSALTEDIHFTYGETSTFNIGTAPVTCKKVTGCNTNADASTNQSSDLNATYFKVANKKIGQIMCYWIEGCKEPYTSSTSCSDVRVLANTQTQGGFVCGTCICDESNNYFTDEPAGFEYTVVDGCYHKEGGCTNPYTDNITDTHFTYGAVSNCTQVTGCRFSVQGSSLSNDYNATYFDVKEITNAGVKCYYVDGCQSPYVLSTACATGQQLADSHTAYAGGPTCGTCECNNSEGYYSSCPSGAACEQIGSCYKTKTGGDDDDDGDGCKESEGWVSSSVNDAHFTYGTTSTFNIGKQTHTCKKVTGCSSVDASTTTDSNINTTYFTRENATYGGVTCYWATGCSADYRPEPCTASEILQDGPRTIATYTCYKCEAQSCNEDGYYLTCPTGASCVTETIASGTCQKATGCKTSEGWYYASDLLPYYTWGDSSSFKGISNSSSVVTYTCKKANGCNENINYYSVCPTGRTATTTLWAGDIQCSLCDCNSTDGYYSTDQESVVTEVVSGCYKNTGVCNETNLYYPESTWGASPQFSFGSVVSLNYMDGGSRKLTDCKKLNGCNTNGGYQSGVCTSGQEASDEATLGSYTCHQCGDCTPPAGTAAVGGCPTGYKAGSYNSSCGGTDYYDCVCDEDQGYYSTSNPITGVRFAPASKTGYPTCYLYASCDQTHSWFILDGSLYYAGADSLNQVFHYSEVSDSFIPQATGQPTNCYHVDGCNSPYVNRACTGSEQEFTSTSPSVPYTLGSYTCRECRSIPTCSVPQVCDYLSHSFSNGSISWNFSQIGFAAAYNTYTSCMGEFYTDLTCADIGAVEGNSTSYMIYAYVSIPPSNPKPDLNDRCGVSISHCFACSNLAPDATTTQPGAGCSYNSTTIGADTCYYNITANTCDTNVYPWSSSNLPAHSSPVEPFCVPGRSDCAEDESKKRYTDFECEAGYHKNGNKCDENDCDYMNLINGTNYVSDPDTDYDCQYRSAKSVNNGAKTITCYSSEVYDDHCNLTCSSLGYQDLNTCSPDHSCQTCVTETVTNDFGQNIQCWTGNLNSNACRRICDDFADDGYYDLGDCDKDYDCQTCTTATIENDLGENITCWTGNLSNNTCRTICDDFAGDGYYDLADCDKDYSCQTCTTTTFTNDLGNSITCWNGNISNSQCRTECEDYTGYYDLSDCDKDYSCQTCTTTTLNNDLGNSITCWNGNISDDRCRTTCDDYHYDDARDCSPEYACQTCVTTNITNDLGNNITCWNGSVDNTACATPSCEDYEDMYSTDLQTENPGEYICRQEDVSTNTPTGTISCYHCIPHPCESNGYSTTLTSGKSCTSVDVNYTDLDGSAQTMTCYNCNDCEITCGNLPRYSALVAYNKTTMSGCYYQWNGRNSNAGSSLSYYYSSSTPYVRYAHGCNGDHDLITCYGDANSWGTDPKNPSAPVTYSWDYTGHYQGAGDCFTVDTVCEGKITLCSDGQD